MRAIASNSKIKSNLLRIILSTVFILTAVLFTNPITAYAKDDKDYEMSGHTTGSSEALFDEDDYNGKLAEGQTRKLSYLYWAGTDDRTGYLMYFVDMSTGKILSEQTTF